MFKPEILTGQMADRLIESAVQQRAPLVVGFRDATRWASFQGRFRQCAGDELLLAIRSDTTPLPLTTILQCEGNISFRLAEQQYFAQCRFLRLVAGQGVQQSEVVLVARVPIQLKRFERRLHRRYSMPFGLLVRADIWPGNHSEPRWSGRVLNLGPGGLQLRTCASALDYFRPGDSVSLALHLPSVDQAIRCATYYRSGSPDGDMALLGMEFSLSPAVETVWAFLHSYIEPVKAAS